MGDDKTNQTSKHTLKEREKERKHSTQTQKHVAYLTPRLNKQPNTHIHTKGGQNIPAELNNTTKESKEREKERQEQPTPATNTHK